MNESTPKMEFAPNPVLYNLIGLSPSGALYENECADFARRLRDYLKDAILHIDLITCVVTESKSSKNKVDVGWWVWFPANCEYFNDKGFDGTVLDGFKSSSYIAPKLKEFIRKFGYRLNDDDPRLSKDLPSMELLSDKNGNHKVAKSLRGFRLSIKTLTNATFDANGVAFSKKYGINNSAKCSVAYDYYIRDNRVHAVRVQKQFTDIMSGLEEPIPSKVSHIRP